MSAKDFATKQLGTEARRTAPHRTVLLQKGWNQHRFDLYRLLALNQLHRAAQCARLLEKDEVHWYE